MLAAEAGFVSLAEMLRPRHVSVERIAVADIAEPAPAQRPPEPLRPALPPTAEESSAIRAARIFHAAVQDAVDVLRADLLRDIAVDIVARELRLADSEIEVIVRRLIAERFAEEPLRVRVAPADAGIVCELPVVADAALAPGDAVLECRSGSINARLGVRLSLLLEGLGA